MSRNLNVEYDEDTAKVLLSIEDASGNFAQVRMSPERAAEHVNQTLHAIKVAQWRKSGLLEAFGGN